MIAIKDQRINQFVEFGQLEKGQPFEYCRNIFIKTSSIEYSKNGSQKDERANTINLATGELRFFSNDVLVTPVEAEIIVTGNKIID